VNDLAKVAVASLAAYRITRLMTTDSITEPLRQRLFDAERKHFDNPVLHTAGEIVRCEFCSSVYAGGAAALLAITGDRIPAARWLVLGLAASGAVSLYHENRRPAATGWS
jgi:hypothetical protein